MSTAQASCSLGFPKLGVPFEGGPHHQVHIIYIYKELHIVFWGKNWGLPI